MDRVFLIHSPRIAGIEVIRSGKVRRAKLYYMRGKTGKATKLRELFVAETATPEASVETLPSEKT
jgi:large subunit ribosomal protein L19